MQMEPATCLVCAPGLEAQARFLPATGFLGCRPSADHLPRLVLPLGPTTQPHDETICLAWGGARLSRAPPARLATRAERLQAEGLARPRRHGARGRAARGGPAHRLERLLEPRPLAGPLAQHPPLRPRGAQPAAEGDHGQRERCGKVALRGGAPPPGPWQGSPCIHDRDQQRGAPAASAAALQDAPQGRQGERAPQDVRRGQKVHRLQEVRGVAPPRKAFDAACGVGAGGHLRGAVRQWRARAAHDAAEARRQGAHVPGDRAGRRARLTWCEGLPSGTIPAEGVTHRLLLRDWLHFPDSVYDGATSEVAISK
jgi:hypothetical protein